MPNLNVTVDGKVMMDGDLGKWSHDPPEMLKEQLKANARPSPWMRAIMLTIADVAMTEKNTNVVVETSPKSWTLTVSEA